MPSTVTMTKKILALAVPATISVFLETVMEVINTIFIGQQGDATMLAALGLAHIVINLIALQPMLGANSALETFVSRQFGAGDLAECGNYLNRGRFVILCLFLPALIIMLQSDAILIAIG